MLNCKQGDFAIIVKSAAGNEGKIVRCLHLVPNGTDNCWYQGVRWKVDCKIKTLHKSTLTDAGFITSIADSQLHPLRDQDGEDEMLRIAGKPKSSNNELVNLLQKLTY